MTINIEEKYLSINAFKKKISEELDDINPNDAEKYFYIENYFFNNKLQYTEERFYEIILEMASSVLKNYLQELEYYVNLKPITPQASSDLEVLSKKQEKLNQYYLELHILYKKYHKFYLDNIKDKKKILSFVEEAYEKIKEVNKFSSKLQDKFIKNLEEKISENSKDNKTTNKFDSSMYH
jgi:hypothetical protein